MLAKMSLVLLVLLFGTIHLGESIRCYECISRLGPGESSACLTGDQSALLRVQCVGPSVCAAYHYQTVIPGMPTVHHITRGCQAVRFGATCEDIFNELRSKGQVLPGHHTCTTCSTDLCNSSVTFSMFSISSILCMSILVAITLT